MKVKVLEQYKETSQEINEGIEDENKDLSIDLNAPADKVADVLLDFSAELDDNDEEPTLDPEAAKAAAEEIKATGDAAGADTAVIDPAIVDEDDGDGNLYLNLENTLTRALDACLTGAKDSEARYNLGKKYGHLIPTNDNNLLVIGTPGCAKTSVVKNWAKQRKVNLFSVNLRDNELYAFVNGYPVKCETPEGKAYVKQAYSTNLDQLNLPDSVLFLDEFNRQTNPVIRQTVMEVVKDKIVGGDTKTGKRLLKGLRFSVAIMNPPDELDMGLAKIGEAESDRFPNFMMLKSTKEDTLNYTDNVLVSELQSYLEAHKNGTVDSFLGDYGDFKVFAKEVYNAMIRWSLLNFMLSKNAAFTFDYDYDDLSSAQAINSERMAKKKRQDEIKGLLSQRTVSNLFMRPNGWFHWGVDKADKLKDVVKTTGNITSDKREMLVKLIDAWMTAYGVLSTANEVGPDMGTILDSGGRSFLEKLCGYPDDIIDALENYIDYGKIDNQEVLNKPDEKFEKELAAAKDDVSKIATIGLQQRTKAGDATSTAAGLQGLSRR